MSVLSQGRCCIRSFFSTPLKPIAIFFYIELLAAILVCFPATAQTNLSTIRIMPFGDSITDGAPVPGGYRAPLYQLLTNAGYKVDFVGNLTDNGSPQLPDSNHEGHSGFRIDQLDAAFVPWVNTIPDPDIILLLIGTNDYGTGQDTAHATNRLDHLIGRITANRPNAKLVVANLLVRVDNAAFYNAIKATFNPFVPGLVAKHAALGEQVYFLDLNSQLTSRDLADGLHPNTTGYRRMATNWFGVITNLFTPLGSTNVPVVSRATGRPGWTNVVVTFSKPVGPEATNVSSYSLSGGLTPLSAVLDPLGQRDVTLLTTPQTPSQFYTVTASNIFDLTPNHLAVPAGSSATFFSAATTNVLNNVPEAANYTMVYSLNIPNSASFETRGVPYSVDFHTNISNFSRVGYYLELQKLREGPQFIWVSMDAYSCDAAKIGLPLSTNGGSAQRYVTNMNVLSSVQGVINGNGLSGGFVEFWPSQYIPANQARVPAASDLLFDWGDQRTTGAYGSMQIHNVPAAQTLFGFNHWASGGGNVDLGIGNSPDANPDWTFSNNGSIYSIKRLQIFALLTPTFTAGPDQTVLEDATPQTIPNWAIHITSLCPFETNHPVEFMVRNNNNALFSTQPGIDPQGTLTFSLAPNANGAALVSVSVHDANDRSQNLSAPQTFRIDVLPVNDPPVAIARAYPLSSLSRADTNVFVLSLNNTDATVYFDASASSDIENDPLQFSWFADASNLSFATGVVATNTLSVGAHEVRLVVSDGQAFSTNVVHLQILTVGQATERLISLLNDLPILRKEIQPFLASLNSAQASFDRGSFRAGLNELSAFQNKARAQFDPDLASTFIDAAQVILDAFAHGVKESKISRLTAERSRMRLEINHSGGRLLLIQASTNLQDWSTIGIASSPEATQQFEDLEAARFPSRYYRLVSP